MTPCLCGECFPGLLTTETLRTTEFTPRDLGGDRKLMQVLERRVNRRKILPYDRLAALAVRLSNRLFDFCNRFVTWQHAANRKEAGLHDRVCAIAELVLLRHLISVD